MPTDSASIIPLAEAINTASKQFIEAGRFPGSAQRQQLVQAAVQLAIAAREPEENLYATGTQVCFLNNVLRRDIR
jgi:hypothetical protein